MVATDLDGTLVGSDGRISERTKAALLMVESKGVEVVFVT
ncbi:MAG: HAD hydrolase family protein, partial [Actinomycetota bacterium]|nr:HAD hydrolase family protein [Actinomycetota bacterium]